MGVFERYTEEARRVVFFARYEAGRRDAAAITPYIVMGLHRECRLPIGAGISLREQLKDHLESLQLPPTTSDADVKRDIPLDNDAKKALAYAAMEADSDGSKRIEPDHLLRGLLCFDNAATQTLKAAGFNLEQLRKISNEGGRTKRFLRRLRWHSILLLEQSFVPAVLRLAIIFIVVMLVILLLRWLNAG
jgi:ATP-dependent Clp protease ATP-binding subunit ClpC